MLPNKSNLKIIISIFITNGLKIMHVNLFLTSLAFQL